MLCAVLLCSNTVFMCLRSHVYCFNTILHTAWLNNHALTLKRNTEKYYFGEKFNFLHTFLNIVLNQGYLSQTHRLFNLNAISVLKK
jgi:hypothetical protein